MLRVFGLTGGIGSGKSSVARLFRERGLPVVDADALAREVVGRGQPALRQIAQRFGAQVLRPDGELDRAELAKHVFADPAARAELERITHPRVRELAARRFSELEAAGEPLACYDVPLLFEAGLDAVYRPVVVVSATPEQQVERASRRDGASPDAVRARIAAQLPLEEKARRADYVIDNSGPLAVTDQRAGAVLAELCAKLGLDATRYARR